MTKVEEKVEEMDKGLAVTGEEVSFHRWTNHFQHIQLMVSCAHRTPCKASGLVSFLLTFLGSKQWYVCHWAEPLKVPSQLIIKRQRPEVWKSHSQNPTDNAKSSSKGGKGGLDRWGHGRQQVDGFTSNLDNFRNSSFDTFLNLTMANVTFTIITTLSWT